MTQETMTNPMEPQQNPIPDAEKCSVILGLGGAGAAIIEQFLQLPGCSRYVTALIDTDKAVVEQSKAERKIELLPDWGSSICASGCGGDVHRGTTAFNRERNRIDAMLADAENVIVCGGLGGGTCSGGISTVISILHDNKIPAMFVLTTPLAMEMFARRQNASQILTEIQPNVDLLIPMSNELLFSTLPPDTPIDATLRASAKAMALAVFGLANLFHTRCPLGGGYAQILSELRQKKYECTLGIGMVEKNEGLDRCTLALERLLASPFLGSTDYLKQCDEVLISVCGGPDLQIGELKRTMEQCKNLLPEKLDLLSGISILPDLDGIVQISAIAIKYVDIPESKPKQVVQPDSMNLFTHPQQPAVQTPVAPAKKPTRHKPAKSGGMIQTSFKFEEVNYGIFENQLRSRGEDGEDLDIPTYFRHNLEIDLG